MKYQTLAAVLGMLLALAPLGAATHSDSPPDGTVGIVGGAYVVATVNLAPQELDTQTWQPTAAAGPTGQRLQSVGTYNCLTGAPASGAGTAKLTFDVVVLNQLVSYGPSLNDHIVTDAQKIAAEEPTDPSFVRYGGRVLVGYGSTQPAAILPGTVFFHAFLKCGTQTLTELPPALPGQTRGIFGWADENSWGNGTSNPYAPEFQMIYIGGSTATAGAVGPGEVVMTPGWYQNPGMQWLPNLALQTNTLRWAVNPSLTDAYPGYTGSGVNGYKRSCITDDSPNQDPETGGLLEYCDNGGFFFLEDMFYGPVAPATVGKPAPLLEDVDFYNMPDKAATGIDVIEPTVLEAKSIGAFFQDAALGVALNTIELGVGENGEAIGPDYGNGWRPILNVVHYSGAGVTGLRADPLYASGFTSGGRNTYPAGTSFDAYLGLGKDTNGDGMILASDAAEWFGIDDAIHIAAGSQLINFGDVGSLDGGNNLVTGTPVVALSICRLEAAPYNPGDVVPVQDPDIARCGAKNAGRPMGDPENGWGTFRGSPSDNAATHGRYGGNMAFYTADGTGLSQWTLTVKARIVWPSSPSVFATAGLGFPSGVTPPWGQTVTLKDVDVFGPTLG